MDIQALLSKAFKIMVGLAGTLLLTMIVSVRASML